MEEREVAERLSALENNVRGAFDRCTDFELTQCKESIHRRLRNLEYILNGYRAASPSQIDRMLTELEGGLRQMRDLIVDDRDEQKRYTIGNLQRTSIELEAAIEGLEQFEVEGIKPTGQDDLNYEEKAGEMLETQTREFLREYGITDPRVSDEILSEMKGLKKDLVYSHDKMSVSIKNAIKAKVVEIGEEFVSRREPKDKANGFMDSLQSQTVSQGDLARSDAHELSDNEKAFKDSPARDEKARKDLEAMFK